MGWTSFNDRLALVILVGIGAIWIMQGLSLLVLPGEITGVLITIATLVVQYYFRRQPPAGGSPPGGAP